MLTEYWRRNVEVKVSEPVFHEPAPGAEALNADTQPGIAGRFSEHDCAVSTTLYSRLALHHDNSPA